MRTIIVYIYFCILFHVTTIAFKWKIYDEIPSDRYFTFSEGNMFADHKGPFLLEQGSSYIQLDTNVDLYLSRNISVNIGLGIFSVSEGYESANLVGICDRNIDISINTWARYVEVRQFKSNYIGYKQIARSSLHLNGSYYQRSVKMNYKYIVKEQAWHNVVLLICFPEQQSPISIHSTSLLVNNNTNQYITSTINNDNKILHNDSKRMLTQSLSDPFTTTNIAQTTNTTGVTTSWSNSKKHLQQVSTATVPVAYMTGTVTFRNPYGFIPAESFGLLPFEAARMILYVCLAIYYVLYFVHNMDSVLTLHKGFLVVLLIALVESTMWYSTYQSINLSGIPYCCPFPVMVIASMVLQAIRQTLCTIFLLVISLGYGIVRPKLMQSEWISIAIVAILYLWAAIISQVADILQVQQLPHEHHRIRANISYKFKIPELFFNILCILWIYLSLSSTIRILNEFQQTYKLIVYTQLANTITAAIIIFGVFTVVFMISAYKGHFLPWQYNWIEQALWESLNFVIFFAICMICKPSVNSRLLSYTSQIPTEDPDDYIDDETHGTIYNKTYKQQQQHNRVHSTSIYAGDDDADELDFDYNQLRLSDTPNIDVKKYSEIEMINTWKQKSSQSNSYNELPSDEVEKSILTLEENNKFDLFDNNAD